MRLIRQVCSFAPWGLALASACTPARPPASLLRCPEVPAGAAVSAPTPRRSGPSLRVVLRPQRTPSPHVHVELFAEGASVQALRMIGGAPGDVEHLEVADGRGVIGAARSAGPSGGRRAGGALGGEAREGGSAPVDGAGVEVELGRPSEGTLHVRYDVRASSDPHARPGLVVVAEDRFRADGEGLVLLPVGFEAQRAEVSVTIEGEPIEAPEVASSFGVGRTLTREARGAALWRAVFFAGPLGKAVFNDGLDRDEGAWLGYSAFDPRPAVAEVAQVRTALRELWKGGGEAAHALFLVSTRRPPGSYSLAGRASSLVVYLGPSEPWSAALRVGITQHLMRSWVGGELAMGPPGSPGSAWFSEGLSRYLAARVLSSLGLLGPNDVQAFLSGLLAVQATSTRREHGIVEAAGQAGREPLERARLVAQGALYAARVDAAIRAKSGGSRSIDDVVRSLLGKARAAPGVALSPDDWLAAVVDELGPGERQAFAEQIVGGREVVLPSGLLGKCFRARVGEYVSFALGFDAGATFESSGRVVAGLDPKGPAAAAGLRADDVIEETAFRDGDASEPVNLSVTRGGKKLTLRYLPRGRSGRGLRFERVRGLPDAACAPVL